MRVTHTVDAVAGTVEVTVACSAAAADPDQVADAARVAVHAVLTSGHPAGHRPCASCGAPYSPRHDVRAPGPTARHPYRPAEQR